MADIQLTLEFARPPETLAALLTPDEIYENASEAMLRQLGEDNRLERKPAGTHRDPLAPYFSMWANTSPEGGVIVLGIDDDGHWEGCASLSQERLNDHDKTGRDLCPDARYDTKRVAFVHEDSGQADFLVLIRVYYREDKLVETNKGDAFLRRGDSCYRMTEEEKREIALDKGQVSFEQEPCALAYPLDFDTPKQVRAERNRAGPVFHTSPWPPALFEEPRSVPPENPASW